jgi:hypothetical protein
VATAIGAEVVKKAAKKYLLRARKPPEEKPPKAPEIEPWQKKLDAAMDRKKVKLPSSDLSLADWVADVAKQSRLPIHLDPKAKSTRGNLGFRAVVTADKPLPVGQALSTLFLSKGIIWDYRWGGVLVSTPERLDALPKLLFAEPLPDDAAEEAKALRETLATKTITTKLKKKEFLAAIEKVVKRSGAALRIEDDLKRHLDGVKVDLDLKRRRLDHALALICFPRDLMVVQEGAALRIVRR